MPGILTHYLCGDAVLLKLGDTAVGALLQKHRRAFNLGTQGPDILFYHGAWPWVKSQGINIIGEKMHDQGSGAFFKGSLEYIRSSSLEKDVLSAYLCGFACHYSLDLHAHPYIFYKTGFVREGEADTKKFNYYHRTFETALDVLMLKRLKQLAPNCIDSASLIKVPQTEALCIGKMYESVLPTSLGVILEAEKVRKAISDMVGITRALRDRTGIKKLLFTSLEKALSPYPMVSAMIHPVSVSDGLDYLNLKQGQWGLPWDNSSISSSSFVDLFEEAVLEAQCLCNAIYSCIHGSMAVADAAELIGNRSFSSSLDCNADVAFQYYSCIYEQILL